MSAGIVERRLWEVVVEVYRGGEEVDRGIVDGLTLAEAVSFSGELKGSYAHEGYVDGGNGAGLLAPDSDTLVFVYIDVES